MNAKYPTVDRMVAVINFFLKHPQQICTLAQVVKSLGLNRATTHSILLGLVNAGYLYRRSDKSYILGPVLPSLASNAKPLFTPLIVASHEMRGLADDLKVIASALELEGNHLMIRERTASVNQLGALRPSLEHRYPQFPLGGCAFLVNVSETEAEAKLDKMMPAISAKTRQDVLTELEFARNYGFIAALCVDEDPINHGNAQTFIYVRNLVLEEEYRLSYLEAPVFDAAGEVPLAISVFGFDGRMTGQEIIDAGARLLTTCERVTTFIRGRRPITRGIVDPNLAS